MIAARARLPGRRRVVPLFQLGQRVAVDCSRGIAPAGVLARSAGLARACRPMAADLCSMGGAGACLGTGSRRRCIRADALRPARGSHDRGGRGRGHRANPRGLRLGPRGLGRDLGRAGNVSRGTCRPIREPRFPSGGGGADRSMGRAEGALGTLDADDDSGCYRSIPHRLGRCRARAGIRSAVPMVGLGGSADRRRRTVCDARQDAQRGAANPDLELRGRGSIVARKRHRFVRLPSPDYGVRAQ